MVVFSDEVCSTFTAISSRTLLSDYVRMSAILSCRLRKFLQSSIASHRSFFQQPSRVVDLSQSSVSLTFSVQSAMLYDVHHSLPLAHKILKKMWRE